MKPLSQAEIQQHIKILGWIFIFGHAVFLLIGLLVFALLSGIGVVSGDEQALLILSLVGTAVGGLLVVLAVPGVVAGIGLLTHKLWGRYLAIVVAFLGLLNFPMGTLLGIYALWVLMQETAANCFVTPQTT